VSKIKLTPTQEITGRFVQAVDSLVGYRNGKRITLLKISESLKMHSSNITRFRTSPSHAPTLEACQLLCKVHKISAEWLLMGTGTMKGYTQQPPVNILEKLQEFKDEIKQAIKSQPKYNLPLKPNKITRSA
jgi:hypothetical protein